MKGSVRKRGSTWSYRIDFGKIDGKRNQIEKAVTKRKKKLTRRLLMHYTKSITQEIM